MTEPVVDIIGVSKQYGALRPLRIERLQAGVGDQLALIGFDQPAAEVLVNLLTGAALPDTGSIALFGQLTSAIPDSDAWLASLDRFGIVSDRAALLEALSPIQNLALPLSIEIEPPPPEIAAQAVALASEVGLPESVWALPCHGLDPLNRMRLRLGRALALGPALLLLEHPSATLPRDVVPSFGREVRAVAERRRLTALTFTMDKDFAAAVAQRSLTLEPANGRLKEGFFARMGFRS